MPALITGIEQLNAYCDLLERENEVLRAYFNLSEYITKTELSIDADLEKLDRITDQIHGLRQ